MKFPRGFIAGKGRAADTRKVRDELAGARCDFGAPERAAGRFVHRRRADSVGECFGRGGKCKYRIGLNYGLTIADA